MQRRYEPIDLVVAIGMSATIVGAFSVFLAAGWTLEAGTSGQTSLGAGLGAVAGQSGLQVPLGQAIVESHALQREGAAATQKAAKELSKGRSIQRWLADSAMSYLDPVTRNAARMEADHAGRIQSVLGREIVNFTRRGVGSEAFASPQSDVAYNSRMLGLVDATRMRMEEDFRLNRQPNLSRAIVGASRDRWEALGQVQRRMGRAQRDVATTEAGYAQATGANQMQLGHLIVATIREEYRMDTAPRPAETAVPAQQPLVLTSELRTWPEIPIGYLVAASAGLLGLFLAGLRLPAALEVRRPTEVVNLRTAKAIYRETIYPLEIGKGVLASR
ncbi:MAG: hypothetical protein E8D45_10455 [Nitrospira sp.]|nr:MAG: hypothetical protein E8D45_10455 [Nitrospira sp.]